MQNRIIEKNSENNDTFLASLTLLTKENKFLKTHMII